MKYLITGGSGFFGSILKARLLKEGHLCVNIDLEPDSEKHESLVSIVGDIRNTEKLEQIFVQYGPFDAVFHLAAQLAHAVKDKKMLWGSNVDGTQNIAEACIRHGTKKLIFTSSNCLWGKPLHRPVLESDEPNPVEIYGRSKYEGEKILLSHKDKLDSVIFRCPTIIAAGRLGLLSILFEFIRENKKLWVVGGGKNRYQFIHADDLVEACLKALNIQKTEVYNIGSDDVRSFREVYEFVIQAAGSKSKVKSLPHAPTLFAMKLCHVLRISPLGPYQYKMIAEDFLFDTTKIKHELDWRPTMKNHEMMLEAYRYFQEHEAEIKARKDVSAHKQNAKMGIIRLLKWIS